MTAMAVKRISKMIPITVVSVMHHATACAAMENAGLLVQRVSAFAMASVYP